VKLLFVSNLYPNPAEPARGTFNAQQVAALSRYCQIVKVVAPVAAARRRDSRPQTADTSPHPSTLDQIPGLQSKVSSLKSSPYPVLHPPFRHIPILSRPFNGWLFARSIAPHLQPSTLNSPPSFDIVLVNWAYPDAYGVMLLAEKYRFPFATTVQGSDINLLFRNRRRKRQILRALRASRAVFCRSAALRGRLAAEGIAATVVYNGVDRDRFHPMDRVEACRQLGLDPNRRRILYVGNLQPVKGPTVLAEAFRLLCHPERSEGSLAGTAEILRSAQNDTGVDIIFVGDGPERTNIERISSQRSAISTAQSQVSSLKSQVSLMGARPHHEVPLWLNACDVLCLPSFNEGLPNVCIEAAACGLPVVASQVGGVPEVVREGVNGFLVPPGDPAALAVALRRALSHPWDRDVIVQSVAPFDWDANARQVVSILESVV